MAAELAKKAKRIKIRSHTLCVAAESDLLRLKEIAKSSRSKAGDAEDIAFLKTLSQKKKSKS
jgi:hypothetical protein